MTRVEGLSTREAAERRARGQGNDVRVQSSRTYGEILRENTFTFMNNVLFALGLALVLLGRTSDAVVSVLVVLSNVAVSVVQEVRAKRTLDRIALLTRPRATVLRDGQAQSLDPSEIVLRDVVGVRPGDQVVVDGTVVGEGRMEVDESLLTGESDLIPKRAGDAVLSGSFCVSGEGWYTVDKVGAASFAQELTAKARTFRRVYTPLQQQINLVIRVLILLVVYFEIMLGVSSFVNGVAIVESVKMSVVLAGLVPNGLFLAIAVAYAMGAVRIARRGALVQQANAIESLSNVDVLCLDKTGTLTANQIRFHAVHSIGLAEPELRNALGDFAANTTAGNRTIAALAEAGAGTARRVTAQVPFASVRKWSALAMDDDARRGVFVLGAPEVLRANLAGDDGAWDAVANAWAAQGLRVVLLAYSPDPAALASDNSSPHLPSGLVPLGLACLSDVLRPEARETLAEFRQAGIQIKIISGDQAETVAALARSAGIDAGVRTASGSDLENADAAQFDRMAAEATIFGRITPQQKEKLVQSLKRGGHYVAMIGDGVNDVLALKQAHLGIAMQGGSQAARSVADIVLLNDSFASLPEAFQEGQRILNGMQGVFKLFLTRIFYVALLCISTGLVGGFPYQPKQSSLLALLTVGIPTIALAAWAHPGPAPRGNLMRSVLRFVLPAATSVSLVGLGVYIIYLVVPMASGLWADPEHTFEDAVAVAQSALTTISVLCGLFLIPIVQPPATGREAGAGRSDWRPAVLALALLAGYAAILAVPGLARFFEMAPLGMVDYVLLGGVVVVWGGILRRAWTGRWLERFLGVELS